MRSFIVNVFVHAFDLRSSMQEGQQLFHFFEEAFHFGLILQLARQTSGGDAFMCTMCKSKVLTEAPMSSSVRFVCRLLLFLQHLQKLTFSQLMLIVFISLLHCLSLTLYYPVSRQQHSVSHFVINVLDHCFLSAASAQSLQKKFLCNCVSKKIS